MSSTTLDSSSLDQLRPLMAHLKSRLRLRAFSGSEASSLVDDFLRPLSALDDRLTLVEADRPSELDARLDHAGFAIESAAGRASMIFVGAPLGHELSSLALALLHQSGHPPKLEAATLARARSLDPGKPLVFETFYSQSCHNCPDTVQALNMLAALNPRVTAIAIDGGVAPLEVERRGILAVPSVYLNGEPFASGRLSLEEILDKLGAASAVSPSSVDPFDILVIGAGPAGASAALYAARKGLRVGIAAGRFGGQVNDTMDIENYPSVELTTGPQLSAALERHARSHPNLMALTPWVAQSLSRDPESGLWIARFDRGELRAKTVILATGASWRKLGAPGESDYQAKGVTHCPHCDGPLFKGKPVAVIGGGNSGVEAALDLAGICSKVTLLEYADSLKADAVLIDRMKKTPNIEILLGRQTLEVQGDGSKVQALRLLERASGAESRLEVAGVFVQIGLLPSTGWLKDSGIELNRMGEIKIDARGATNLPGVFACGDSTDAPFKQIVTAAGAGAVAALSAFEHLLRH